MPPDITVGISAYNSAEFIAQAVESVLKQAGPSLEVIVVDDGSTDDTVQIVQKLASADARVTVHQKENRGLGASRNDVLRLARGRYIHFMDGDDYMGPNFVDAMVGRADAMRSDVLLGSYYEVTQNDFRIEIAHIFKELAETANAFHWSDRPTVLMSRTPVWEKLYRRDFLHQNDIQFIETGAEDIPFSWQTLVNADRIGAVWTPYFYYRVRQGSITGGLSLVDDVFTAVDTAQDFVQRQQKWDEIRPYFVGRSISEMGYLIMKARPRFANDNAGRLRYFNRLIERFNSFDLDQLPQNVADRTNPLYVQLYAAVRNGLSADEMESWFASHVSPYAPQGPKKHVAQWNAGTLKATVRFALNTIRKRL